MTSIVKPSRGRIGGVGRAISRIGALPFACATVPLVVLATNSRPPAPLLPCAAVLLMVAVAGLTALLRGYGAVGLIELLSGDLHTGAARKRAITLRRARDLASMTAVSLALAWIPIFYLRLSGAISWPPVGDAYLVALPLLRVARLYDLCCRYRPPERAAYAYDLVATRIGSRACSIGAADLGLRRLEFMWAYLRG